MRKIKFFVAVIWGILSLINPPVQAQQTPGAAARPNTSKIEDAIRLPEPKDVQLAGLLGERFQNNLTARLLNVDENQLLEGFRSRPGKQAWIGEHVGKFLHAASLSFANTQNAPLKEKIDRVAAELIKTQEADGYLGTYAPDQRFGQFKGADWDVWVHKYDLIGLLTYYQYTGNAEALEACKKIGDLLMKVFGPGEKNIVSAGTHKGMAATSVIEPIVMLYRFTGDEKYLEFGKEIVEAYEHPDGPKIVSTLMAEHSVLKTANAKAYEMLSNLSGLCELYRATGDKKYLDPVLTAWQDIVAKRLYITGSGSSHEHWREDFHLPNTNMAEICETCVTVSWEQLNIHLMRLTGEPKYGDQLCRTIFNHLLAAQEPDGKGWCYYTPLEGKKPFGSSVNCCLSSGPRGIALLPMLIFGSYEEGVRVNFLAAGKAKLAVPGGTVDLEQKTDFPFSGEGEITVTALERNVDTPFRITLRHPDWAAATEMEIKLNGQSVGPSQPGYFGFNGQWKVGDKIAWSIKLTPRMIPGDHGNEGKVAYAYGPLILAADQAHNPDLKKPARAEVIAAADPPFQRVDTGKPNELLFTSEGYLRRGSKPADKQPINLVPFFSAGADRGTFVVWIKKVGATPGPMTGESLLAYGEETRSRDGNVEGEIADANLDTFVVTFDGKKQEEDWYAVDLDVAANINRVVFVHGSVYHNGGWFETSGGKPRVQVKKTKDGQWEEIAKLDQYPDTTTDKPGELKPKQAITVEFAPTEVWGVRVIGKPASGDDPTQNFSSCAEIQGYLDVP